MEGLCGSFDKGGGSAGLQLRSPDGGQGRSTCSAGPLSREVGLCGSGYRASRIVAKGMSARVLGSRECGALRTYIHDNVIGWRINIRFAAGPPRDVPQVSGRRSGRCVPGCCPICTPGRAPHQRLPSVSQLMAVGLLRDLRAGYPAEPRLPYLRLLPSDRRPRPGDGRPVFGNV